MINRVYQSQGKWNEAFDIAERYDRIHLRNTHYNYAKYMESIGGIEMAIEKWVLPSAAVIEFLLSLENKIKYFIVTKKPVPTASK
jgi:intraflagellar transport protein 140